MMEIQTNSFGMNRKEYFRILVRNYFQKRLWFYSFVYGIAVLMAITFARLRLPIRPIYIIFILMIVILPFCYLFWFWHHSGNKENAIFYREGVINLSDDFLEATLDDGSIDKIRWQNILHYKKVKEGYLLYISKQQFIFLPDRAFRDDNDLKRFEVFIATQLKNK